MTDKAVDDRALNMWSLPSPVPLAVFWFLPKNLVLQISFLHLGTRVNHLVPTGQLSCKSVLLVLQITAIK